MFLISHYNEKTDSCGFGFLISFFSYWIVSVGFLKLFIILILLLLIKLFSVCSVTKVIKSHELLVLLVFQPHLDCIYVVQESFPSRSVSYTHRHTHTRTELLMYSSLEKIYQIHIYFVVSMCEEAGLCFVLI